MKKNFFPSTFLVCVLFVSLSVGQVLPPPPEVAAVIDNHKAGERMTFAIKDIEYAFRWCPSGTFTMGSPVGERWRKIDETQHQVTLSRGFWMLETEATQGMWESVMGNNPSNFKGAKRPVEMVSWNDCQEYIKKLNDLNVAPAGLKFSLPTEAQWEYACRAGTTTAFHFGDTTTLTLERALFSGLTSARNTGQTKEVGSYPANDWGLHDMHGSVWEWCSDLYEAYPDGAATDPTGGSAESLDRVFRGGSWHNGSGALRSAWRDHHPPTMRQSPIGCRIALVSTEK